MLCESTNLGMGIDAGLTSCTREAEHVVKWQAAGLSTSWVAAASVCGGCLSTARELAYERLDLARGNVRVAEKFVACLDGSEKL